MGDAEDKCHASQGPDTFCALPDVEGARPFLLDMCAPKGVNPPPLHISAHKLCRHGCSRELLNHLLHLLRSGEAAVGGNKRHAHATTLSCAHKRGSPTEWTCHYRLLIAYRRQFHIFAAQGGRQQRRALEQQALAGAIALPRLLPLLHAHGRANAGGGSACQWRFFRLARRQRLTCAGCRARGFT